jgi:hypothetical protein
VPVFSMVDSALDPESRQIARHSLQTFELAPPSSHPQSSVVATAPFGSKGGNPLVCGGVGGGSQFGRRDRHSGAAYIGTLYAWAPNITTVIFCVES